MWKTEDEDGGDDALEAIFFLSVAEGCSLVYKVVRSLHTDSRYSSL